MSTGELSPPAALFVERLDALRDAARLGPLVDLACGRGRHALASARAGIPTLAIDRNRTFLAQLQQRARGGRQRVQGLLFDLEAGSPPPLRAGRIGAVLVFHFLYRPLAPEIERALAPGGVLLYETFTTGQRELGSGPRNPAFLLEPGELPSLFPGLEVLAYQEGLRNAGLSCEAVTGRLFARKPAARGAGTKREREPDEGA